MLGSSGIFVASHQILFVLEGLLIIAQRFIAGYKRKQSMSPGGTTENLIVLAMGLKPSPSGETFRFYYCRMRAAERNAPVSIIGKFGASRFAARTLR